MSKPTHFKIYFDTSVLRNDNWLAPNLEEVIEKVRSHPLVTVELMIPEVVRDEWVKQFKERANGSLDKAAHIEEVMTEMSIAGYSVNIPSPDELTTAGQAYLDKLGFKIIPTPYSRLDMQDITRRAVHREVPFDESEDKGIKDAIITFTIHDDIEQNLSVGQLAIFVCNDKRPRDYLNEITTRPNDLHICDTLSDLQLQVELKASDLSSSLAPAAKAFFFDPENKDSLFIKDGVAHKIYEFYSQRFPSAESAADYIDSLEIKDSNYIPAGLRMSDPKWMLEVGKYSTSIGDTEFIDVVDKLTRWRTEVTYTQRYLLQAKDSDSGDLDTSHTLRHDVVFEVEWTARLDSSGNLTKGKIINQKPVSEGKNVLYYNRLFAGLKMPAIPTLPLSKIADSVKISEQLFSSVEAENAWLRAIRASQAAQKALLSLKGNPGQDAFKRLMGEGKARPHFWEDTKDNPDDNQNNDSGDDQAPATKPVKPKK